MRKITRKFSESGKGLIIWRHHLSMLITGEGKNGIVVKNLDTSNKSSMVTNEKKDNKLYM